MKTLCFENFNDLIEGNISKLNIKIPETKAYIQSLFVEFLSNEKDLSNKPIILEFEKAKQNYSFNEFQKIADWILFGMSNYPKHFQTCSEEYYISIGRISYYKCYKILNRQWPLFEELSDRLDNIIYQCREINYI